MALLDSTGPAGMALEAHARRLMLMLTVLSFASCVWLTEHHRVFAFYALPTRAWEFGLGAWFPASTRFAKTVCEHLARGGCSAHH